MATIQSQQILLPKKVYIGDTAELRCPFNSDEVIFSQLTMNGPVEITTEVFTKKLDAQDFEILQLNLEKIGENYFQLTVTFKPWKTGNIIFPPAKIGETEIIFEPVNVVSIIEQNSITSLKENTSPLLLPGTTYKVYGAIIIFIILMIVIIRLIVKRKKLAFFIQTRKLLRKYKKNRKITVKKLRQLTLAAEGENPGKISDKDFATEFQHILRNYMEVRFDYPFTKSASSELMKGFFTATNHILSAEKEEAFGDIVASFIRTDFIRYSENASFGDGEKSEIVKTVIEKIEILERCEEDVDTTGAVDTTGDFDTNQENDKAGEENHTTAGEKSPAVPVTRSSREVENA